MSFKNLFFLGLVSFFASCSKKEYTCTYPIIYQPVSVVFKGFSSTDLTQVQISTYSADGSFSNKLSDDVFDFSNAAFAGDTAYVKKEHLETGLYNFEIGKDYEITVVSTGKSYRISQVKEGSNSFSWSQKEECSMGAGQVRIYSDELSVNGQEAATFYRSVNNFLVCLSK